MSLSNVDMLILADIYVNLDNPPANIADNIGRNRSYVSQRLEGLSSQGLVWNKGAGTWALTWDGMRAVQTLIAEGEIEIDVSIHE